MAQRSVAVSLALFFLPNIFIVAFIILSPELNEALSNDTMSRISVHGIGIFIGILFAYRYRLVEDHEYQRSRAIGKLSKTYRMEDRGLWERGDLAIMRLEKRAHSGYMRKKHSSRMQGNIGDLYKEGEEETHTDEGETKFSVVVDGVEQTSARNSYEETQRKGRGKGILDYFLSLVESTASKRVELGKKKSHPQDTLATNSGKEDSQWVIPQGSQRTTGARYCKRCSTYNNPESNYCLSCGSYIS